MLDTKLGLSYIERKGDQQFAGQGMGVQPSLQRSTATRAADKGVTFSGKDSIGIVPRHTIVAGWDAESTQRDELRRQNDLPDEDFTIRVKRLALFAQDEWTVAPRWSAYLGMRWERIATYSAGSRRTASASRSAVLSPIVQTLYKLAGDDRGQLRLALARTYKAPAVGNLNARPVLATVNTSATPDYRGNPGLRPELAWGLDFSYEYFMADGAMFSAGGYLRRIDDLTGRSLDKIDGRWVSMPANVGRARSQGLELEARIPFGALAMRANFNRNWSRVDSLPRPGNVLDGQTPLSLNLAADYAPASSRLSAGASLSLQTGGTVRTSANETVSSATVRSIDAYALYRHGKHVQMRLALSNQLHPDTLSGSRYEDAAGSVTRTQREQHELVTRLTLEYVF